MYPVKRLSRDKGPSRYTKCLPSCPTDSLGQRGRVRGINQIHCPNRGLYQIQCQSVNTHRGKHRPGGARQFWERDSRGPPQQSKLAKQKTKHLGFKDGLCGALLKAKCLHQKVIIFELLKQWAPDTPSFDPQTWLFASFSVRNV